MSKYCIYWDRPTGFGLTVDDEFLGGCTIFGVHHDCEKCPNLIEMGEEKSYTSTNDWKPKEE